MIIIILKIVFLSKSFYKKWDFINSHFHHKIQKYFKSTYILTIVPCNYHLEIFGENKLTYLFVTFICTAAVRYWVVDHIVKAHNLIRL